MNLNLWRSFGELLRHSSGMAKPLLRKVCL